MKPKSPKSSPRRRPRAYSPDNGSYAEVLMPQGFCELTATQPFPYKSEMRRMLLTPDEARRLAAWLLKFADWAETAKRREK